MDTIVDTKFTKNYGLMTTDALYTRSAVLLNDILLIFRIGKTEPIPLMGFYYSYEGDIEMLRYEWGENIYLNKQMLALAPIKQNTSFSLLLTNPINKALRFHTLPAWNEGIIQGLEYYMDRGGTFTVLTMWGTRTTCVAESVTGVANGNSPNGTQFRVQFKKLNLALNQSNKILSDALSKYKSGGIAK